MLALRQLCTASPPCSTLCIYPPHTPPGPCSWFDTMLLLPLLLLLRTSGAGGSCLPTVARISQQTTLLRTRLLAREPSQ
jgi:hypothetical protein